MNNDLYKLTKTIVPSESKAGFKVGKKSTQYYNTILFRNANFMFWSRGLNLNTK